MPARDSDLSLVINPLRLWNLTMVWPLAVLLNRVVSPSGGKFSELLSIMVRKVMGCRLKMQGKSSSYTKELGVQDGGKQKSPVSEASMLSCKG